MKRNTRFAIFFAAMAVSALLFSSEAFAADYKVVQNDTLYGIGRLFGTSSGTLMTDNNLKSSVIYPGQILKVDARVYTVKSGDTLYQIAKSNGISLDSLMKANNKWNSIIKPGQQLLLPGIAPVSSTAVVSYSASDLDLLARLVTAEAENQPYSAQVAVAAVVINRVQSDEFEDTIRSVIYEVSGGYYQFTPVENGYINKTATAEAKKAAYAALYGSDPSKGALFYFDDSATNKWLWSKPQTAYIGDMVFVI